MIRNSKYLYGPRDVVIPANIHFGEFMLRNFWKYEDNVALINGSTHEVTKYHQLAQQATNLAVSLTRLGVQKGEVIAIMADNRPEYFSIFVAIACAGAVVTTINPLYTEGEMKHILSISKPTYLFCTSAAYKHQEKVLKSINIFKQIIIIDDERIGSALNFKDLAIAQSNESSFESAASSFKNAESSLLSAESSFENAKSSLTNIGLNKNVKFDEIEVVPVNGQTETLVILYSSGTTGLPKGVMLTHHNIITMCKARPIDFGTSLIMTIGPWFHAMGLVGTFSGLTTGNTFAFLPKFELEGLLKTVEKYRVEMLVVVPAVVVAITKSSSQFDFSSVRRVLAGAAPLHKDTSRDFGKRFPNVSALIQGYGMTECCLAITKNSFSADIVRAHGTVGRVLPNCVIKFVDLQTGEPLSPNQNGELCVKGDILMKGYVGRDLQEDLDDEGFFRTGDVGYYDEQGLIYIVDRVKELIKYKGNQVAPAELEAILLQHDAVREAGVVGMADELAGELPVAFVSLQPGKMALEDEVKEFVAARVSNPKRLRGGVRFLDDIPKNATGKIMRSSLRRMANKPTSKL